MNTPKLFLIDGMALIFRAYYALRMSPRYTSYKKNTNAQFGFTNTLLELIRKNQPTHMAVAFDTHGPTERHQVYEEYKANREATPEDIIGALPDIRELLEAMHIPLFEMPSYEADDIIGTLTRQASKAGMETYMVTMDKDYIQLVDEKVFLYQLPRGKSPAQVLGVKEVCAEWDLQSPRQIIDLLALMGDNVDNIPGVRGIGAKTAQKLVKQYGGVTQIIENLAHIDGKIGQSLYRDLENLKLSQELATIKLNIQLDADFDKMKLRPWNMEKLSQLLERLEFRTIAKKITNSGYALDLQTSPKPLREPVPLAPVICYQDLPSLAKLLQIIEKAEYLVLEFAKVRTMPYPWIMLFRTPDARTHCLMYHDLIFQFPEAKSEFLQKLHLIFASPKRNWVGFELKAMMRYLHQLDINLQGKMFDLRIAGFLLDSTDNRNIYSQTQQYLHYQAIYAEYQDLTNKGIPDWQCWSAYISEYMEICARLYPVFREQLQADTQGLWRLFQEVEMPLLQILATMERKGIAVDVSFLSKYSQQLASIINEEAKNIYQASGQYFNIASPRQLGEILFAKMQLKDPSTKNGQPKKTKTGQFVTDEETLRRIATQHPVVEHIIRYREVAKIKSTYADGLIEATEHGRIHSTFVSTGALTGRLSSQNPNLQNIPVRTPIGREIRRAFTAKAGYKLLCADYSQIELRIMAALSADANMIEDFRAGRDIHTATASRVFAVPEAEVNKEMRRRAKGVNFGIIYGQTAFGLAKELDISKTEAEALIEQYFQLYPGVAKYIETEKQRMQETEVVRTLGGRRRYLLNIKSANPVLRNAEERTAINMPIQGSAADMIKMAMVAIAREIEKEQLKSALILQVHDELVFEMAVEEEARLREIILQHMCSVLPLPNGVPIEVEIGIADNWLDAH